MNYCNQSQMECVKPRFNNNNHINFRTNPHGTLSDQTIKTSNRLRYTSTTQHRQH